MLARVSRLPPAARRLVDAVALVPPRVEPWLLDEIGGADLMEIDACLSSGVLCSEPGGVGFRHELARRAVEDAVPSTRRLSVHRTVLHRLTQDSRAATDSARLAHHAEAAGDTNAVLAYAPAAAERATLLAAHREAAAQYARALRFAQELPAEARADAAVAAGVDVLERLAPGRELAMAYSSMSASRMNAEDREGTIVWGRRALTLHRASRRHGNDCARA